MLRTVQPGAGASDGTQITPEEAAAMARAVLRLFDRWKLRDAEARTLLGDMTQSTWGRWKAGRIGRIDRDLATRLSLLMGIHKALRYVFSDPARAYGWIRRPNARFEGRSALEVMLEGSIPTLMRMRAYLDAERSGL